MAAKPDYRGVEGEIRRDFVEMREITFKGDTLRRYRVHLFVPYRPCHRKCIRIYCERLGMKVLRDGYWSDSIDHNFGCSHDTDAYRRPCEKMYIVLGREDALRLKMSGLAGFME